MTIEEAIERMKNKSKLMNSNQAKEDWSQLAEWLENYKHLKFQIGEILVDVDKLHITQDEAIEKIREVLRKYY